MIQFIVNKNQKIIPQFSNRFLCSYQRPLSEAEKWLAQFDLKQAKDVLVIGGGGGFHIEYLKLKHPDIFVHVFDFRTDILEHLEEKFKKTPKLSLYEVNPNMDSQFYKNLYQFLENKLPEIMPFRPGWQGMEVGFEKLYSSVLAREVGLLARYLDQSNSNLAFDNSLFEEKKNFLTLKNLVMTNQLTSSMDSHVMNYFGEFMK